MKLWVKIAGISLSCTIAALSVCLYIFSAQQSERILANAEKQTISSLELFCTNLQSANRISLADTNSELVKRNTAQYYFALYSHMMDGSSSFSLVYNGEYLYNVCPYDPASRITFSDNMLLVWNTFEDDGVYNIIAGQPAELFGDTYYVYICTDVTEAYLQVKEIAAISALLLVLSAVIVLVTVTLLVRRTLKPMENLKNTAESIADGEYSLRANIESKDEVAALALAFNDMAEAVECRIDELTEESERRKLMLGALAHELKTPMTAIIGFADSLLKMPLNDEQRVHCAEQVLTAGQRTERISQKLMLLLSLSEGKKVELKSFALEQFAEELRQCYNSRVHIVASGIMTGDRDLLFSLAQNLINNAVSASPDGKTVEVLLADNKITVSDSGRGIPHEHIARLTEPFYRVDKARSRRHGGAGLGLSLCKAIAEAHGGTLTIESEPDVGTTVTATIKTEGLSHENSTENKSCG